MRTILFPLIALLIALVMSGTQAKAQENQDKTRQKEAEKKQKELELQKKQQKELDSITEESQAEYDEQLKALLKEQKKAQEESKEVYEQSLKNFQRLNSDSRINVRVPRPPRVSFFDPTFGGSGDNTTFTISKNLKNTYTFSSDFEYEVPGNVTGLYFDFTGELESGNLKLTLTKPDGKTFQVISVSPVANVDWNKKFNIKEGEAKQFAGIWKITISTKEAKGFYELRINSY